MNDEKKVRVLVRALESIHTEVDERVSHQEPLSPTNIKNIVRNAFIEIGESDG